MAKQIEGVYERILECAEREFLEKGFKDASLRVIASNAQTTTGSIYTRFGDKEGLFQAIVEPVVNDVMIMIYQVQENFHNFDAETQKACVNEYSFKEMEKFIDYIYAHFDKFRLLLDASYGTRFQHFVEELAGMEVEYTYKYMEIAACPGLDCGLELKEVLHIVSTSYFEGVFEVVRRGMDREAAGKYIRMLERYHAAGFDSLFYPQDN